jgi:phosphate transport system substrate-binding protein
MRRGIVGILMVSIMLIFMAGAQTMVSAAEVIRIGGTGISLGSIRALAGAFEISNPGIKVIVPPSLGSNGAVRAVSKKAIDIGILARELNDDETGLGLLVMDLAKTPMIVVANKDVGIKDISISDIIQIYRGEKTRWPDGRLIRAPIRPAGETSAVILRKLSPEMNQAMDIAYGRTGLFVAYTDQHTINFIEKNSGSLGFTALSLVLSEKRKVKILRLDGVNPSIRNLANGSYPLSYHLFICTNKEISSAARKFLDFIRSSDGRKILSKNGFLVPAR